MKIFKKRFIPKIAGLLILALIVLTSLTNAQTVKADVAPPEPPSGTNPIPGSETTNVRMMSETVLITIDADSAASNGFASVNATFTMRNLGDVDEQMNVSFPLDQTIGWAGLCYAPFLYFPPISDLKASVNGKAVETQKTYQTVTLPAEKEPYPTASVPCWAHFPVSFPVGKDVIIQITYTAEPYDLNSEYSYSYVLLTGDGWKGTIGSADIIFQVPYELNDSNYISCLPDDCKVSANTIQWHYENFDPFLNINVSLLPPPLWQKIVAEKENLVKNPEDGEAWGRLGKAYKESIRENRGFRSDAVGREMYRLSRDAYQQAVTLLPKDADWHYGFADLLCWNAEWNRFLADSDTEAWQACVEQIKQVFDIDPSHKQMKALIQDSDPVFNEMIDFSGAKPNYIILTPKPTTSPAPTVLPTKTAVITASSTSQIVETTAATETTALTPTSTTIPAQGTDQTTGPVYVVAGMLMLVVVLGIAVKFKK
jgi:tetratricopeptide (TPR) repeat protein